MIAIFYFIPFFVSSFLLGMERELPVIQDKHMGLIDAVCQGFIEKPLETVFIGYFSNQKYIFACLKCDKISTEEKEKLMSFCTAPAERGDAQALCNLGYYCQYIASPVNPENARKFYTLAAIKGLARACYYLGEHYESLKLEPQAFEAYKQAADRGYEQALLWMAFSRYKSNQEEGLALYKKADELRRAFFKNNPDLLEINEREKGLIDAARRDSSVPKEDIDSIPYLGEKAILYPAYGLLLGPYPEFAQSKLALTKRALLGVKCSDDSDLHYIAGALYYDCWNTTKNIDDYMNAFSSYMRAGNHALAEYKLGLLFIDHEEDVAISHKVYGILLAERLYGLLLSGKGTWVNKPEKSLLTKIGHEYLAKAASKGHMMAQEIVTLASLKVHGMMPLEDVLKLIRLNYKIKIDEMEDISTFMKRFIKEHVVAYKDDLISICRWLESSCKELKNGTVEGEKKDKSFKKIKKKNNSKITDFQSLCLHWSQEIEGSYQNYEKRKHQEEKKRIKLERAQQKKLLKEESKSLVLSDLSSIKAIEKDREEECRVVNPLGSQTSPDIRVQRTEQNEIELPIEKKPKVKRRPLVSEQQKSEEKPKDRPTISVKPPLIRSMSAVALVRKNSKTDLNDPKYKRLVKRLSYSDVMAGLKLGAADIKSTLEELAQRNLIDYRDEKTTITATKKNDHTVPLVIHMHGDWASNRDIVKQFLEFVYKVDPEYWQLTALSAKLNDAHK